MCGNSHLTAVGNLSKAKQPPKLEGNQAQLQKEIQDLREMALQQLNDLKLKQRKKQQTKQAEAHTIQTQTQSEEGTKNNDNELLDKDQQEPTVERTEAKREEEKRETTEDADVQTLLTEISKNQEETGNPQSF